MQDDIPALTDLLQKDPKLLARPNLLMKHYGHTNPMHIAAMLGHVNFVEAIPGHDSSYQMCLARDEDGRNPCHLAAMYGRLEVLKVFIRPELIQAALERADCRGNILHLRVKYNQLESLKLLLSKLKDARFVNAKNDDGCTILHMSTYSHKKEMIECLLESTKEGLVDLNMKNEDGETALDLLLGRKVEVNDEIFNETRKSFKKAKALKGNEVIDWDAKHEEWYQQRKQTVMLVASLIAGMAFAFEVNPPGGTVLVDVENDPNPHKALKPVISQLYPGFYKGMIITNTLCFIISFAIIVCILCGSLIPNKVLVPPCMYVVVTTTALTYVRLVGLFEFESEVPSFKLGIGAIGVIFSGALCSWAYACYIQHQGKILDAASVLLKKVLDRINNQKEKADDAEIGQRLLR